MITYATPEDARADVGPEQSVCAALLPNGEPVYFLAPATAERHEMSLLAFEATNGRPMSDYEQMLLGLVLA
jgi:hypothetical protein